MSNYNISKKLIKKLNDVYSIDYMAFLDLVERYKPDDFSIKYIYAQIKNIENNSVIDLGEILKFNIEDLNKVFINDCDLKLEMYKIMRLKEQVYKFQTEESNQIYHYNNLNPNNKKTWIERLIIDITFSIVPATGVFNFLKKDKCYSYLHANKKPYHFKNIYDLLLTSFNKIEIECSEEYIKNLNKEEFDKLMSIFDMASI
jgi:hypothetical protein